MPLWGTTDADEKKPVWLPVDVRERVIADNRGWVYIRPDGIEEVLVAISIAGFGSGLGAPDVDFVRFPQTTTVSGTNVQFVVTYNEPVTVGAPGVMTIPVSGFASASLLHYNASLSTPAAGRLVFTQTTSGESVSVTPIVNGGQSITLSGATTLVDTTDGTTNATLTLTNTANETATITLT